MLEQHTNSNKSKGLICSKSWTTQNLEGRFLLCGPCVWLHGCSPALSSCRLYTLNRSGCVCFRQWTNQEPVNQWQWDMASYTTSWEEMRDHMPFQLCIPGAPGTALTNFLQYFKANLWLQRKVVGLVTIIILLLLHDDSTHNYFFNLQVWIHRSCLRTEDHWLYLASYRYSNDHDYHNGS